MSKCVLGLVSVCEVMICLREWTSEQCRCQNKFMFPPLAKALPANVSSEQNSMILWIWGIVSLVEPAGTLKTSTEARDAKGAPLLAQHINSMDVQGT